MGTPPVFETFWRVNGQDYFDIREVAKLVEDGHLAKEISAEDQYRQWKHQKALEEWHRMALASRSKYAAELAHRATPEGRNAEALRFAAQNPGGVVTGPANPVFDELDAHGPDATNVFK